MTVRAIYPKQTSVNLDNYQRSGEGFDAYFGLPNDIIFCKTCVYSNQYPTSAIEIAHTSNTKKNTLRLDDQGVCDACRANERKKQTIDWVEREKMLIELCNKHRSKDGKYDRMVE